MKTIRTALLILSGSGALQACGVTDLFGGADDINVTLQGLPASDTLRQTGIEFSFDSDGTRPFSSVMVVVDPAMPGERTFVTDGAWREEAPERFPVLVPGPLSNGKRRFELRVTDAKGRSATSVFERTIHVPEVAYTLQFLGAGFDDSRTAGINSSGKIAGTVYTGVSPAQTSQLVTWMNGVRTHIRTQSGVMASATGINSHGEIVASGTIDGNLSGFFLRGDSLEALRVNNQQSFFASGIDNNHRALLIVPGVSLHFQDVNGGNSVPVPLSPFNLRMNGLGQVVAVGSQLYGTSVATYGGLTIRYPEMRPGRHERYFRGVQWGILAVNDRGDVLGTREGDPFLSMSDAVEYLDQRLPATKLTSSVPAYTLAASGDVVSLGGADSLYIWSREKGTRRITFTNPGWTLDGLGAMNVNGLLLVHGMNSLTGEKGALLLSPTAASVRRH